jgi:hypothetical protein
MLGFGKPTSAEQRESTNTLFLGLRCLLAMNCRKRRVGGGLRGKGALP